MYWGKDSIEILVNNTRVSKAKCMDHLKQRTKAYYNFSKESIMHIVGQGKKKYIYMFRKPLHQKM